MALIKGRDVRVEVGLTEAAAAAIASLTQASVAVIGITAHGLANGSVGYVDNVVGMDEMEGQAVRVQLIGSPADANTFNAEGIDSSEFGAFTSGDFTAITAWATLSQSTRYQLGGDAPETGDVSTLLDRKAKNEITRLAGENATIDMRALTQDNAALAAIRAAARAGRSLVFRITHNKDGAQRLFYGEPSSPGEGVGVGEIGSGSLTVTVKGDVLFLGPVA
jgi:hypothetical protein